MTAPRPEIQRLEFYVEDDGDRDPWAVPHNDPTGDYVRHSDHLRAVTLATIEILESLLADEMVPMRHSNGYAVRAVPQVSFLNKIAALRKELE